MAGDIDSRYNSLRLAPAQPIRLTIPGTAAPAPAVHRPRPYSFGSGKIAKAEAVEDHDGQHLLPAVPGAPQPRNGAKCSCWRKCRTYIPKTTLTRSLALILLLQAIICIGLEGCVFGWAVSTYTESVAACMGDADCDVNVDGVLPLVGPLVTIIFESVYQVFLSLDAARRRNTIQVIGICLNNLSMCVFIRLAFFATLDIMLTTTFNDVQLGYHDIIATSGYAAIRSALHALIIIPVLNTAALCFVAWRLYREFEWAIYRHISAADIQLRKLYLVHEIYIALLHLDLFFLLGFWVQSMTSDVAWNRLMGRFDRFCGQLAALLLLPLQLWLAGYSARHESAIGQAVAILPFLGDIALITLELRGLYQSIEYAEYSTAVWRTIAYAGLALPLLLATFVMAAVCTRNFNRGLKPILQKRRMVADTAWDHAQTHDDHGGGDGDLYHLDTLPARMELD